MADQADREHDTSIDKVLDAMAKARAGPDGKEREPVTYDQFQSMLDSTPLFMRETPKETEGDYVLEALKSLVFEGEGDGESQHERRRRECDCPSGCSPRWMCRGRARPLATCAGWLTHRGRHQLQEPRQ